MNKLTASETLKYVIELLLYYLENFDEGDEFGESRFISGERTAYVECLEIVQCWEHARLNGLDFDIEARFPI